MGMWSGKMEAVYELIPFRDRVLHGVQSAQLVGETCADLLRIADNDVQSTYGEVQRTP